MTETEPMTDTNVTQPAASQTSSHRAEDRFWPVAPGVGRLCTVFVNLYVVDLPGDKWVLIDTGLPNSAWYVQQAAESRYGTGARPEAIILTHGHFDHAGNAKALAQLWNVPVYAHPLEMPYLTAQSDYAPQDPTNGGAISFMSRFFPVHGIDLKEHLQPLLNDQSIPSMPGWRWIHTPGHTAGHVSLMRDADHLLISGDAVTTVDLDSWTSQFTWPRKLSRPPTPLTPDWQAARDSIRRLADADPRLIASGHGLPIERRWKEALHALADSQLAPPEGRYSKEPVHYNSDGSVQSVPPPVSDSFLRDILFAVVALVMAVSLYGTFRQGDNVRQDV